MSPNDNNISTDVAMPMAPSTPDLTQPASSGAASEVDDLDALLSEFDRHSAPPVAEAPPEPALPDAIQNAIDALAAERAETAANRGASEHVGRLQQELSALRGTVLAEKRQTLDRSYFDNTVKSAKEYLGDLANLVPDGFVEGFLLREYAQNPHLAQAWQQRYTDPLRAEGILNRECGRAMKAMARAARAIPDPIATGDRMSVAAAVRGSSSARAPERTAPAYSKMTPAEFDQHKSELFGEG